MATQIKRICLITPGHIASNPRLVKEASALVGAGYQVHIIFTQYMDYLVANDTTLLDPNISYSSLIWTKDKGLSRLFSGLIQKSAIQFAKRNKAVNVWTKIVLNRNYRWQYDQAVRFKADLYIAHNAGALAVAADAALKHKSKFAFDAEDFHRGEDLSLLVKKCLIQIEDHYLPKATYLIAASPLIANAYEQLYKKNVTSILNVFPKPQLRPQHNNTKQLKLFWFSQTIGFDRGIEGVIKAIGLVNNKSITLHLLGAHDQQTKEKFNQLASTCGVGNEQLHFYQPVAPDYIFDLAMQFDLGMATETGKPYNRDICLTNKIFTYIQAGLAVIASDTLAQLDLFKKFPEIGKIYARKNLNSLADQINFYLENPEALAVNKQNCLSLGNTTLNWEIEQYKIVDLVTQHLDERNQ